MPLGVNLQIADTRAHIGHAGSSTLRPLSLSLRSERLRLAADLHDPLGADHLAETLRREPRLFFRDVRRERLLDLARETDDLLRVGMARVRAREQPLGERMDLVMRAVARLEERDVGRPQASEPAEPGEQDRVLGVMMPEEESSRGAGLRDEHVERRRSGHGVQRADERVVNGDEPVVRLDEGIHGSDIRAQVSLRSRPPLLTIGAVVKRSGVAASALRFYEERGLIASVRVGAGKGHRRYGRSVLRRIAFIVFAQRIGLSLDEIALELAKLPTAGPVSRRDWARISKGWDARVKERLVELERLRASLTTCIGCGCLSLEVCPLSNPGDRAARAGAGPRFWLGDKRATERPSKDGPLDRNRRSPERR